MQFNPYLHFNGNCEEAFKFYQQCLGAKLESMHRYGGSPMADKVPAGWENKVLHAVLAVGDRVLMGADLAPDGYQEPKGFSLSVDTKNTAEAERIFNALAQNGAVEMPLQQTFWAARFGMLTDQFHVPWMVNCEQAAATLGA